MATYLQVPMVPSSLRTSSSSLFPTSSFHSSPMNQKVGWRYRNVSKRLNYRCFSAKIPLPPVNPNDPFIKRIASSLEANPELKPSSKSDELPPFLDIFTPPKMMSSAQGARYGQGGELYGQEHKTRRPPPDIPSTLFEGRIIYLGMPMVPEVTELLMAEFMYLSWVDDKSPIYLYINSTGTTRDDNTVVAAEAEGFAIYDVMMTVRNDVETVAFGACSGHACLLLAAGKEGRRFMFPHCRVALKEPRIPSSGLMQASDVFIHMKEAISNKDMLYELFALHTGIPLDVIEKKLDEGPWYMGAKEALEFNVVDKILWQNQGELMKEMVTPEQWEKLSANKSYGVTKRVREYQ